MKLCYTFLTGFCWLCSEEVKMFECIRCSNRKQTAEDKEGEEVGQSKEAVKSLTAQVMYLFFTYESFMNEVCFCSFFFHLHDENKTGLNPLRLLHLCGPSFESFFNHNIILLIMLCNPSLSLTVKLIQLS